MEIALVFEMTFNNFPVLQQWALQSRQQHHQDFMRNEEIFQGLDMNCFLTDDDVVLLKNSILKGGGIAS